MKGGWGEAQKLLKYLIRKAHRVSSDLNVSSKFSHPREHFHGALNERSHFNQHLAARMMIAGEQKRERERRTSSHSNCNQIVIKRASDGEGPRRGRKEQENDKKLRL